MTDLTYTVIRKFTFVLLDKGDRKLNFLTAYNNIAYLFKTTPAVWLAIFWIQVSQNDMEQKNNNQSNKITRTHLSNLSQTVQLS